MRTRLQAHAFVAQALMLGGNASVRLKTGAMDKIYG